MTRINNYYVIIGRDGNRPVSKWSLDDDGRNAEGFGTFEKLPNALSAGSDNLTSRILLEEPDALLVE